LRIKRGRGGQSDVGGRRHCRDGDGRAELRPARAVGAVIRREIVSVADNFDIFRTDGNSAERLSRHAAAGCAAIFQNEAAGRRLGQFEKRIVGIGGGAEHDAGLRGCVAIVGVGQPQ